jgi:voltage-gated potassium channel
VLNPTTKARPRRNSASAESELDTEVKTKLDKWEHQFGTAMTAGGFLFLIAYAIPILLDGRNQPLAQFCEILIWVLWVAFAIDFVVRFILADNKTKFLKRNVIDLVTLAVPMLRPMRALTVVERFSEWAQNNLRGKWLTYVISGAILLVLVGSLAVTEAERGIPDSQIHTWGAGLVWAFEAVTDIGFGEYEVVSTEGHLIGVGLMIAGLVVTGFIIAAISAWFIENLAEQSHDLKAPATIGQVERIIEQHDLILQALGKMDSAPENEGSEPWAHPARTETEKISDDVLD